VANRKAFSTPIVVDVAGQPHLISPGAKGLMALDLRSGTGAVEGGLRGLVDRPRPLFGQGLVFVIDDYKYPSLDAVRPDGHGDVSATHVAGKLSKGIPNRPSPVLVGNPLLLINSEGVALCVEAKMGEVVWKHRMGGNFSPSPIEAGGRVYFFDEAGVATVIEADREFRLPGVNHLADESLFASPAVVGDARLVRTEKNLYRIQQSP
jgi:outer membrane protein assembly factor BamB